MPMNRVQFQAGMSLREFQARYGTERQCRQALQEARWPYGFRCPSCEGAEHSHFERAGRWYWQCTTCREQTSLTSGTVFEASKLALTTWFLAMYLLTQTKTGISALERHRHLGVSYRTAWLLKHKRMLVMFEQERDRRLEGVVQVDDAFLGGERTGGKRGRGSENKVPLIAAVQTTADGQAIYARLDVLPDWKMTTVARWALKALKALKALHARGQRRAVQLCCREVGSLQPRAHYPQHRHRQGQRPARALQGHQHAAGQLQDVDEHHVPRLQGRALRAALPRRVPIRFNRRFDLARLMPDLLASCAWHRPATEGAIRTPMSAELGS